MGPFDAARIAGDHAFGGDLAHAVDFVHIGAGNGLLQKGPLFGRTVNGEAAEEHVLHGNQLQEIAVNGWGEFAASETARTHGPLDAGAFFTLQEGCIGGDRAAHMVIGAEQGHFLDDFQIFANGRGVIAGHLRKGNPQRRNLAALAVQLAERGLGGLGLAGQTGAKRRTVKGLGGSGKGRAFGVGIFPLARQNVGEGFSLAGDEAGGRTPFFCSSWTRVLMVGANSANSRILPISEDLSSFSMTVKLENKTSPMMGKVSAKTMRIPIFVFFRKFDIEYLDIFAFIGCEIG